MIALSTSVAPIIAHSSDATQVLIILEHLPDPCRPLYVIYRLLWDVIENLTQSGFPVISFTFEALRTPQNFFQSFASLLVAVVSVAFITLPFFASKLKAGAALITTLVIPAAFAISITYFLKVGLHIDGTIEYGKDGTIDIWLPFWSTMFAAAVFLSHSAGGEKSLADQSNSIVKFVFRTIRASWGGPQSSK